MEDEFIEIDCPDCEGMVDDEQYTCTTCWCQGGDGVLKVRRPTPLAVDACPACEGVGNMSVHGLDPTPCSACNGTGSATKASPLGC